MSASAKANRLATARAAKSAYHKVDKVLKSTGHDGVTSWLSRMAAGLFTTIPGAAPEQPRLVGIAMRQRDDL
jgi:hypothetical protein